jgi:hypothetical protein
MMQLVVAVPEEMRGGADDEPGGKGDGGELEDGQASRWGGA